MVLIVFDLTKYYPDSIKKPQKITAHQIKQYFKVQFQLLQSTAQLITPLDNLINMFIIKKSSKENKDCTLYAQYRTWPIQ